MAYISQVIRNRIRSQAQYRCGYCLSHQQYIWGPLEVKHIIPTALGGTDDEHNLWLACSMCNTYKGAQIDGLDDVTGQRIALFNPRQQQWSDHFYWSEAGDQVIGSTPCGRVTVAALQLNNV